MATTLAELAEWMRLSSEDEHIEFKEAKRNFHFDKLVDYCTALANEGGGKIVLGVTDAPPRRVVGSQALKDLPGTRAGIFERIDLRVDIEEIDHSDGRVVVLHVPPRHRGIPVGVKGRYLMRVGEQLRPMTPARFKCIFDEGEPDFSATVCDEAQLGDLAPEAIRLLRESWGRKSGNEQLDDLSDEHLLGDLGLVVVGGITHAALILLATPEALSRHLPQAEVIFEYRSDEASIQFQQREEFRQGLFLYHNDLWDMVNLRNDLYHYQEGFFVRDIPTFNEAVVREGILNAISHRDYRSQASVFVRQFPRNIEITSPGGFPEGVTAENILWSQRPRNRLLAEVLAKCGLVERSGQGVDLMYRRLLEEGKAAPDYNRTDEFTVWLTLPGEVEDINFVKFLQQIANETQFSGSALDLVALSLIGRDEPLPDKVAERLDVLLEAGVIEKRSRKRYMLSRRYYAFVGKKGTYTRLRGLDRETNKELLLKHITDNQEDGSTFEEFTQVLPALSRGQVQYLVLELRNEDRIYVVGRTRGARWYPRSAST